MKKTPVTVETVTSAGDGADFTLITSKTYTQHPLSAAFPAMSEADFAALKDSIVNIGVQNPITVFEGMVIDGWHRYSASMELGMDCPVVELGDVDPRDFVLAQNKARRHVSQAQLAMATTAVFAWKPVGANQHQLRVGTECPPKSNAELADAAGVSEKTIKQAKAVQTKAAPEVVEAVKRGEIGLPKAAAIAKLPPDQQAQAISKPLARPVVVVPPPPSNAPVDSWSTLPPGDSTAPEGDPEDYGPSAEEIAEAEAADRAERELVEKMLAADDKMAMLFEEAKQLKVMVAILESRRDELMNKAHAIEQIAKKRDRENLRLRKELDALKKGGAT